MPKVNFTQFKIFTGPSKEKSIEGDVRESLSELLYKKGTGVIALSLSTRIYESEGELELSPKDLQYLKDFAEIYCTPQFISSLESNIIEEE